MDIRKLLYRSYEARLAKALKADGRIPRHIGVILDGNRRWAKSTGADPAAGHRRGASKISEVLTWSAESGVEVVTLWMLSTDNLERDPRELAALLEIIGDAIDALAADGRWRLQHVGEAALLPAWMQEKLSRAAAVTEAGGLHVNVAVGYGGRHEIVTAVRSYLHEQAAAGLTLEQVATEFAIDHITKHLYTNGQPDPDLLIRTSGEQRLGGFLMWQSTHTEFYFCDAYWPDFRRVDFLRALRSYGQRERRMGK